MGGSPSTRSRSKRRTQGCSPWGTSRAADRIISVIQGGVGTSEYDGYGTCYLEFGHDEVARVEVRFVSGQPPTGTYNPASAALAAEKAEFGASRIQRWFDRAWTTLPEPY